MDDEIMSAINEYVSLIRRDHHKSKDLVFLIEKRFDAGSERATYWVEHPGYVNDFSGEFGNSTAAHNWLLSQIRRCIANEKEQP